MRTDTRMVHCGPSFDAATGAIGLPIHLSSSFRQDAPGVYRGYDYARTANPTRSAVEVALAELEGGARGLLFGSGMAALTALFSLLDSGERVVVGDDVYGGRTAYWTRCSSASAWSRRSSTQPISAGWRRS